MKILLASSSKRRRSPYLSHIQNELRDILGDVREVLFIPYAKKDWKEYSKTVSDALRPAGISVQSITEYEDAVSAVKKARSVFVGGGNTFRLLARLYEFGLLTHLREAVKNGTVYIVASAGANLAGPTIMTTNDMPILHPPTLQALGIVPFQINPHYPTIRSFLDRLAGRFAETRDERLAEFLEENDIPIVAMKNGAIIKVENGVTQVLGTEGVKVFKRDAELIELKPGECLEPISKIPPARVVRYFPVSARRGEETVAETTAPKPKRSGTGK